jgi:hypothetical protein
MATEPRAAFCPTETRCGQAHLPDFSRGFEQHEPINRFSSEVGRPIKASIPKTTCSTRVRRLIIGGETFMRKL